MNLEEALGRLLCDAAFRARVSAGDLAGLDDDAQEALARIDVPRVSAAATAVVREVRGRRHRGVGTLEDMYGDALAPLEEQGRVALFARFVSSQAYQAHGRSRTSLEEAFARFVVDECKGFDAAVVERLFLRALTRSLAICGEPSFSVPALLQRRPRGWCAVTAGPTLFAAVDGRAIEGPIDDVIAVMICAPTSDAALDGAIGNGLSHEAALRLLDALRGVGLAPPTNRAGAQDGVSPEQSRLYWLGRQADDAARSATDHG